VPRLLASPHASLLITNADGRVKAQCVPVVSDWVPPHSQTWVPPHPQSLRAAASSKRDDVGVHPPLFYRDLRHGHGEVESARPGTARIQVEDSVAFLDRRAMGVAADHDGDACGPGLDVQVVLGMHQIKEGAAQFHGVGLGEFCAEARSIDVAADGGEGRDLAKALQDRGIADVAGVEDVADTGQGGEGFGAEEAVGIGEDADGEGGGPGHSGC
jgi:hypothetical protein